MKYVTRYFRKKISNVNILGKMYQNFGWSASQLRSCSTWYFRDSDILTKEDVIMRIGDFSNITPAAKKAARIGQCFSSSTPFNFKKRPNIVRNNYHM